MLNQSEAKPKKYGKKKSSKRKRSNASDRKSSKKLRTHSELSSVTKSSALSKQEMVHMQWVVDAKKQALNNWINEKEDEFDKEIAKIIERGNDHEKLQAESPASK